MLPLKKGFENANGIQLYYEIYGAGYPLVLIHGGGSSILFDYGEMIPRLAGRFQLIGIDLQNHGRSDHRDIPETFEQDARDVVAVLENLGITTASFMGFSNGGNTVMQIAGLFPEKVNKLIVGSAFYKRSGMIDGFFDGLNLATIEHMPQALKDNFLLLNPDEAKLQNMFQKDSQRMIGFRDWDEDILRAIRSPTLFICSDRDIMKPEHSAEMWRLVADARLMILPAGHGGYMMADENGNVDKQLIDFTTLRIVDFLNG